MEYSLYLESGPRKKKTMVHVLDLPGCIARGDTTEEALEQTPEAVRSFLRFCQARGEGVDADALFTLRVAQHVMEGNWLANGDPTPGFQPDFEVLPEAELEIGLRRLGWLLDEILLTAQKAPLDNWLLEETGQGRSIVRILEHLAESQAVYLRYLVGKVDGVNEALKGLQSAPAAAPGALHGLWTISIARMGALTPAEREMRVPHGQVTWTARRALRRMLEHAWEHYQELAEREA